MQYITDEQIDQADAKVEAAEQARAAAESAYARGPARTDLYREFNEAVLAATHATARAKTLRAQRDEQMARVQARVDAEKAMAKEAAAITKKLGASSARVVEALAAAETAVRHVLAVAAEHDQAVRVAASDLRARGLTLDEAEEMGGRRDGSLRVAGEDWRPIDGPSLLDSVLRSAVAQAHPHHLLGRKAAVALGGVASVRGRDAILARLRATR
jgi:hypothetical protein